MIIDGLIGYTGWVKSGWEWLRVILDGYDCISSFYSKNLYSNFLAVRINWQLSKSYEPQKYEYTDSLIDSLSIWAMLIQKWIF